MPVSGGSISVAEWVNHWSGFVVGFGILAAVFLGSRVVPALARWRDSVWAAVARPFQAGARAEALAREVLAELRPNGGMSLRDAVMRVEDRQIRFQARMGFLLRDATEAVATFETNAEGLCTWVSPAYAKLCGRPAADLMGWGWVIAIHDDDIETVRQEWRLAVEERRPFERHMRIVHPAGHSVPVISRAVPLTASGKLVGWSGAWEIETGDS